MGKREHHLTALQCGAQGSINAYYRPTSDARPRSRPYRLSGLSRPKITRDPRDEKDERDERDKSEVADNIYLYGSAERKAASTPIPDLALVSLVSLVPLVSK